MQLLKVTLPRVANNSLDIQATVKDVPRAPQVADQHPNLTTTNTSTTVTLGLRNLRTQSVLAAEAQTPVELMFPQMLSNRAKVPRNRSRITSKLWCVCVLP